MPQETAVARRRAAPPPPDESRPATDHPRPRTGPARAPRKPGGRAAPDPVADPAHTDPAHSAQSARAVERAPSAGRALPAEPARRAEAGHRNEIVVAGRITAEPLIRELPSGDRLATWRICVARPEDSRYAGRAVDSITCASFDRALHEGIRAWRLGDVVQMSGELRRRTWRGREGVHSVCEVEARTAVLVRAARPEPAEHKGPGR